MLGNLSKMLGQAAVAERTPALLTVMRQRVPSGDFMMTPFAEFVTSTSPENVPAEREIIPPATAVEKVPVGVTMLVPK